MNFPAILMLGLSLMIGTFFLVTKWEQHRIRRFKEAGVALGLRAFGEDEPMALPSVELLRKRRRSIGAALKGTWRGESVAIFDLSYPAGKSVSQTTVFMLRLREPRIPEFAAIRKSFWLYLPSVDLPRLNPPPEPFRHGWYVYAPDEKWTLTDAVSQAIGNLNGQWSCEGYGSGLYLYQHGKRTSVQNLEQWMDAATVAAQEVVRNLPHTLVTETLEGASPHSVQSRTFTFRASWKI
jgi:hypothetical protein